MNVIAYSLKGVAIAVNSLFFTGVYFGMKTYNKKFRARRVHKLTVGLAVGLMMYILILMFYAFSFVLEKHFLKSAACLFFAASPFLIGISGNDYNKAKTYFIIQLIVLIFSLLFIIFVI